MNITLGEVFDQMDSKQSVVLIQEYEESNSFAFLGNPIDALSAKKMIKNYVIRARVCFNSSLVRTLSKI